MTSQSSVAEAREPPNVLGIPLDQWALAARVWIAMMLALAAGFWLQLDDASSAAVTVAILAQPRRGQALRKAAFRFAATIVGCTAAIIITGVFNQARDLFVVAFAAWLGLAVYVASCYDGLRAYGLVLSGYTVAIIAVTNVDAPQSVFDAAMARLAVVALGIASIALVNDVLAAPDVYPTVRRSLRAALADTRGFVAAHLAGHGPEPHQTAELVGRIVGLRLDVETLPSEAAVGAPRAAAANSASVAMVGALSLARTFAAIAKQHPGLATPDVRAALDDRDHRRLHAMLRAEAAGTQADPQRMMVLRCAEQLALTCDLAPAEIDAMEAGRWPRRRIRSLPIHRDREAALRKAISVFLCVLASGAVFVLSSWPQTAVAYAQLGVYAALGATTPDVRTFVKGAMIAIPAAAACAGITEFIILNGVDAFPLLALAMAPGVFLAVLLSLRPKTAGIGFLLLVYQPVIFPPANPQSYDPQSYLYTAVLSCTGVFLLALILFALPPTTDRMRRRWLVNRARRELIAAAAGRCRRTPEEVRYLSADRMVALAQIKVGAPAAQAWRLGYLLTLSTATLAAVRAHECFRAMAPGTPGLAAARSALARLDAGALDEAAMAMARAEVPDAGVRAEAAADLAFLAGISRVRSARFRHLRSALPR